MPTYILRSAALVPSGAAVRTDQSRDTKFRLALILVGIVAAIAVTGASAADFESDTVKMPETPGENALLRCPTGFVGAEYEVEIESEEGRAARRQGNLHRWYEIVNSSLPPGLTMISGSHLWRPDERRLLPIGSGTTT